MARKIVVTSGKGGVGKTTVCANLGARLAGLGFRVAIIDVDLGLNNLDVVLGLENKVTFDLLDVIEGKCRVKQALVQDSRYPLLYILPSVQLENLARISDVAIKQIVDSIDFNFDFILLDCPAGIGGGFHRAVFCADEAIVVVTPHISSIRDADKVVTLLSNYNLIQKYLVLNRARGDLILSGESFTVESIAEKMNLPILGVIPEDDEIPTLSLMGGITASNLGGRAFSLLAENLCNSSKKIYDCTYKYRGVIGTVRRALKRKV